MRKKTVTPITFDCGTETYSQNTAQVLPGASVWLYGLKKVDWRDGKRLEKPVVEVYSHFWKIGDYAEYDSYNLSYMGRIVSITEKTVIIEEDRSSRRRHRLPILRFSQRNRGGMEEKHKRNAEWCD